MARKDGLTAGKKGKLDPVILGNLQTIDRYALSPFAAPPAVVKSPVLDWGMDGNDVWGNCVIAGFAHLLAAWNAVVASLGFSVDDIAVPTAPQAISQYQAWSGAKTPGDANDTGLVISTSLQRWQQEGAFGGVKVGPFAPASLGNTGMLRQGIATYGAVGIGIQCPESAEEEFNDDLPWTYEKGSPTDGGHFIVATGYHGIWIEAVSWGAPILLGPRFLETYADEYWVPVGPQLVAAGVGPRLNEAQMVADLPALDS